MQNLPNYFTTPNKMTSENDIKGLVSLKFLRPWPCRAFELLKFPEIGDMKPTDMMRQMKALLPTDDRPGTYFMASFLLRLPSDRRDHLIAKDFKDCTKMAEYADLPHQR
jgi:hypothetical protein